MTVLYTNIVGKSINIVAVVFYYFAVSGGITKNRPSGGLYIFLLGVLTLAPVGEKKKASPTENSNGLFSRTN